MIARPPSPLLLTRRQCLRGFTLVELLVVIVILGILMAVAVPTFLRQQAKAQDSRTQQYLTTAFKAIRASTPDTNNQYPSAASMVSWITQSEPELTATSGSCLSQVSTAAQDKILVDPSSSATSLQLCARSQSGNVFKLTATNTGVQQLLDGTLVPLTTGGALISDTTRPAQGDGLQSDSSTGVWEATTNLVANGGFESSAADWTGASGGASHVQDASTAVFGGKSMKVTYYMWGGGTASTGGTPDQIPVTAGNTYTESSWVKVPAGQVIHLLVEWTNSTGSTISSSTLSYTGTGNWQRISQTVTAPAGAVSCDLQFNDNGTDTLVYWVDGVQFEQKPYATPYVDTNGATASRSEGYVEIPISLINATQGWVAIRVRLDLPSAQEPVAARIFDGRNPGNGNLGDIRWGGSSWAAAPGGASAADSWSAGAYRTFILSWTGGGATSQDMSMNGAAFVHGFAALSTPPAWFSLGNYNTGGAPVDGEIMWFAVGTGTLSNTDAATINSWGNSDPKVAAFPASAQAEMVWNGVNTNGSLK